MKIGDLVAWRQGRGQGRGQAGIIVSGPLKGTSGERPAKRYAVAWLHSQETLWHLDIYLELLSESR